MGMSAPQCGRHTAVAEVLSPGRQHRANGQQAYHVLDLMHSFHDASREEQYIHVASTMERSAPLPTGLATYSID